MAKDKNTNGKMKGKVAVGVGIGMLAAGLAGAYYLYGTKDGAKKRQKVRGWALKAKGEVLEKIENLKEVNENTYNDIVTNVMKKYSKLKNVEQSEVRELVSDLRKHWGNIKKHLGEAPSPVKQAKKSPRKTTKKTA